ncbi:hypothetical protein HY768_00080 [candidate division TA06 bacterium]|uniref:Cation/multidrug efflux pump n=1 Tax=candidate division TA06 bacterium TaxID=2250710 RepID=A0A933I965_UNCT6|nr:hypothetical protein [candidate division TA06 bacterium]
MDTFAQNAALLGLGLGLLAVIILVASIALKIKKKIGLGSLWSGFLFFLILLLAGATMFSLSLFARTYSLLSNDQLIGTVTAFKTDNGLQMRFTDETTGARHVFPLAGDQWMIQGYILRWKPFLRFLGAKPYYRITRFSGRWESPDSTTVCNYQLVKEPGYWGALLRYGQKLPLIDAVQGIAAFQHSGPDTFMVYITDAGFVLKK